MLYMYLSIRVCMPVWLCTYIISGWTTNPLKDHLVLKEACPGPVTVPIVLALGIGIAATSRGEAPSDEPTPGGFQYLEVQTSGCFYEEEILLVGVLTTRALLFGICIWAP